MDQLALIVGLLLATVVAVGLGDRLRLPYPVLMLLLAVGLTFIPGFPDLDIAPELILPIFLPPLLFATAQRSSWAVFRVRWRTLIMLAVALVVISTAVVAGAAWLMIRGDRRSRRDRPGCHGGAAGSHRRGIGCRPRAHAAPAHHGPAERRPLQ